MFDFVLCFRNLVEDEITATYSLTKKFPIVNATDGPRQNLRNSLTHHA
jgi:hypothetical protein